MRVFDSSAIYKVIKENKHSVLTQAYTSPLAFYELGNIVLKNSAQFKLYSNSEAKDILNVCDVVLEGMQTINSDLVDVYNIAEKYHLSFYDATYVAITKQLNASLVTLDKKLINKSSSIIKILPFDQL